MTTPRRLDEASARHELPHPIAVLCDRLRTHDDASRLSAVLVLAEGVARYLALILLADAAARGASAKDLSTYVGLRGFGSALATIQHFANAYRRAPDRLFPELDGLIGGAWWQALDRFKALRNDASHARVHLTAEATTLLRRHDEDLRTVIDGCAFLRAYPLGILRGVRTGADGSTSGRWQSCRGPTPRGGLVELHDAGGIPSDQLLLVDSARGRALTVAPFLCLIDDEFYWLDLPAPNDPPRPAYRSPVPGVAMRDSLPAGLHDPSGRYHDGRSLQQWLGDRNAWPRYANLSQRPAVLQQILASSQATRLDVAPLPPRTFDLARAPSTTTPIATRVKTLRPMLPGLLIAASLLASGTLVFEVLGGRAARAGSTPALAPLSGPLESWLREWHANVLAQQSDHGPFLDPFYARAVRFRGSRGTSRDVRWITGHWHTLLATSGGSFAVDWSQSRWRHEALDPTMFEQSACRVVEGATGDVVLVRLRATEIEPNRAARARDLPCDRLDGVYLVRLREVAGTGLVICHEGWSTADGVCAPGSCPQAPVCRSR